MFLGMPIPYFPWCFHTSRFNTSSIALTTYAGWGTNATNLLIQPDVPFVDDQPAAVLPVLSSPPPPSEVVVIGASDDNTSGRNKIIIGVVVGVGGLLIGLGVAVLVVALLRRWAGPVCRLGLSRVVTRRGMHAGVVLM